MVGRDKTRTYWRVLKIDKASFDLNILEDFTTYSESQCSHLLNTIHEGNKSTGGLTLLTTCYGILGIYFYYYYYIYIYIFIKHLTSSFLGFIKFLGPYYMLVITKRRPIGSIGGHPVYAISKTHMFALSDSPPHFNFTTSRNENRLSLLLNYIHCTDTRIYEFRVINC